MTEGREADMAGDPAGRTGTSVGGSVFLRRGGGLVDQLEVFGRLLVEVLAAILAAEADEPVGLARLFIDIVDAFAHVAADFLAGDDTGLERISGLGLGEPGVVGG